jgi:hypothetical protein
MSNDVLEVRAVLASLTPKVKSCAEFRAQHVGSAMYGLHCMNSDELEVRAVLAHLAP